MSVYEGIMKGLSEAVDHAQGKRTLRTTAPKVEPLRTYAPSEIKMIRKSLDMTQSTFAGFMGVSPKTVEAWEAGRNAPEGPARRILSMVQHDPQLPARYRIISPFKPAE